MKTLLHPLILICMHSFSAAAQDKGTQVLNDLTDQAIMELNMKITEAQDSIAKLQYEIEHNPNFTQDQIDAFEQQLTDQVDALKRSSDALTEIVKTGTLNKDAKKEIKKQIKDALKQAKKTARQIKDATQLIKSASVK